MPSFSFKIIKKSKKSLARAGILKTAHGEIETPAFAVIATQATVKSLAPEDLKELGVQLVLANTYHLHLRPGEKIIEKAGGLHDFMRWPGPIMTDSGGFQVFSLGWGRDHNIGKIGFFPGSKLNRLSFDGNFRRAMCLVRHGEPREIPREEEAEEIEETSLGSQPKFLKIEEKGVSFRSHIDGSLQFLSPEKSMEIQKKLGADMIFAFDECTSPLAGYEYTKKAMERTHRWAIRCLKATNCPNPKSSDRVESPRYRLRRAFSVKPEQSRDKIPPTRSRVLDKVGINPKQMIFGIIQGGEYRDLREESAKFISSLPFGGIAIGGSLGKSKEDMNKVLKWVIPILPEEKPRHLLGIGQPGDLQNCVKLGIDIFDCVWPTRLARRGALLIKNGRINIKSAKYLKKFYPIEKDCKCSTCRNFTLSYLCHLFRAQELLYHRLATIHNIHFTLNLLKKIRQNILADKF